MSTPEKMHNLLVVSDMHVAEGIIAEEGDTAYGHDAFLYDGAFARFLRYHQQLRREAEGRVQALGDEASEQDRQLTRPWRLVIAGDFIDFWDIVRVPGSLEALRAEIEERKEQGPEQVTDWLTWQQQIYPVLAPPAPNTPASSQTAGAAQPLTYPEIRASLDALNLADGPLRRALEELAWWIQVLVGKADNGYTLTKSEKLHGLGSTWQEVVWKLTQIYRGHRELFAGLAWFIACGNEVRLMKGNHDLELYWPEVHGHHFAHILADAYRDVQAGLAVGPSYYEVPLQSLEALPAPSAFEAGLPSRLFFDGWFYHEKDLVYIEHGNQYEPADSSISFLNPIWPGDPAKARLELPWGYYMVRYLYNKIVAIHPFAVNIKPEQRIIQWMIDHDFFRILGIILVALPDLLVAVGRAVRQGFRGGWIWGDRSLMGLLRLFLFDLIRLFGFEAARRAVEIREEHERKRGELASALTPYPPPASSDGEVEGRERTPKLKRGYLLLNVALYGLALALAAGLGVALVAYLATRVWPVELVPVAIIGGVVGLMLVLAALVLWKRAGLHTVVELVLQFGVVGLFAGLAMAFFLAPRLELNAVVRWAVPLAAGLAAAIAYLILRRGWAPPSEVRRDWRSLVIRSIASVLRELSFAALLLFLWSLVCVALGESSCQTPIQPGQWLQCPVAGDPPCMLGVEPLGWLLSGLSLLLSSWLVGLLHIFYVERQRLDRLAVRWFGVVKGTSRTVSTIVIALLTVAVLLTPIAGAGQLLGELLSDAPGQEGLGGTLATIGSLAGQAYDFLTAWVLGGLVPRVVLLLLAIGAVILLQLGLDRCLVRFGAGGLFGWLKTIRRVLFRAERDAGVENVERQLEEIEQLARNEQRRWSSAALEALTLLVPMVLAVLLVIMLIGLGRIVAGISGAVDAVQGVYLTAIAGGAFWLIRQLSASFQRKDPQSGFGDLFFRMATSIADILSDGGMAGARQGGSVFGRPRYLVFGHDHWADAQRIPRRVGQEDGGAQQWYVNSGTWQRGYIEEQRMQEAHANHSTFVQIIPSLGEGQAPRVLRWNDGANQPERVVRREKPASAGPWDRWAQGEWRLVMLLLLGAAALSWILLAFPVFASH